MDDHTFQASMSTPMPDPILQERGVSKYASRCGAKSIQYHPARVSVVVQEIEQNDSLHKDIRDDLNNMSTTAAGIHRGHLPS